jgi:alkanesulfonate monooxygenase SsuD/methylene tetrahydromethanopterin reductase-like flavin-dependent oxidoreductase (luciferase family)
LVGNGTAPTFGLWYDFRQRLPLGDYARFYAECLEEIEEGERLGFTGAWLSEHHFVDDGYLPSPLVAAAAIAARTRTMTIGTNVLLLPMHHPLRVAEDAAVVDLISDGRFVLGVGQGYVQHEFETLGFERKYRPSLFEEGIEVIRHALAEGRTGYKGRRWSFDDLPFGPRPEGRLPVYIGAFADPAIDRAARLADGFLASAGGGAFGETYRKVLASLERTGAQERSSLTWPRAWFSSTRMPGGRGRSLVPRSLTSSRATPSGAPTGTSPVQGRFGRMIYPGRGIWSARLQRSQKR